MKKILFLGFLVLFATQCSLTKKPEFQRVDAVKVENISLKDVTLQADAVFKNVNSIGGKIAVNDLHIFVNDTDIGQVAASEFDVPKKSEFTIPLKASFSLSKLAEGNDGDVLSNILNTFTAKTIKVKYVGTIQYRLGNFSYPYKINKEETIKLRK